MISLMPSKCSMIPSTCTFLLAKRTSRPNDIVSFERFACQRCGKVDEDTSRLNYRIGLSQICTIRAMLAAMLTGIALVKPFPQQRLVDLEPWSCHPWNQLVWHNHAGITMRVSFNLWRMASMKANLKTWCLAFEFTWRPISIWRHADIGYISNK